MNFKQKVAVITGGANGIGLCIAKEFAMHGAKVAIIDIDEIAGKRAIEEISAYGGACFFYHGNLADLATLEGFAQKVIRTYGKIHYLINNACISRRGILSGCEFDDFNEVLKVGLTAPYMLAKLFKDHFLEGGAIINIASTRACMSQADTESYTAAKGGILALTHGLAVSLAGEVRVNSISPGWIDGRANQSESDADCAQHLSKRIGMPQDCFGRTIFMR